MALGLQARAPLLNIHDLASCCETDFGSRHTSAGTSRRWPIAAALATATLVAVGGGAVLCAAGLAAGSAGPTTAAGTVRGVAAPAAGSLGASIGGAGSPPEQRAGAANAAATARGSAGAAPRDDAKGTSASGSYLPVILLHGAALGADSFDLVRKWISASRPGTQVLPLKVFEGGDWTTPLPKQVEKIAEIVRGLTAAEGSPLKDGYHLLCHSQGALICRALCEEMDDHKVHTLVSLAGPQMGVFGGTWLKHASTYFQAQLPAPSFPLPLIPSFIPGLSLAYKQFYLLAYTSLMQRSASPANLWNDPMHQQEFLSGNVFLPEVNGLVGPEAARKQRRSNFLRLHKAVFLGGSFRERRFDSPLGVEPWQSSLFGFYAEGSEDEVVPMEQQHIFVNDTFGLRSLSDTGRLHVQAVEGVHHGEWLTSRAVFEQYVLPHLS